MCLILFSWQQNPNHPLILIANRDERYQRPSQRLHQWQSTPGMVAGRDLVAGGTWLGVHKSGRFAALTNVRSPDIAIPNTLSRGELIPGFFNSTLNLDQWCAQLQARAHQYAGFNLLFGDISSARLVCYNNQSNRLTELTAGLYGLSNADLDDDWPKVKRGKQLLSAALSPTATPKIGSLWTILGDDIEPLSDQLPDTGVGIAVERLLAPITIRSEQYGTCSSTVLISNHTETVCVYEQQRRPDQASETINITLTLTKD